MSVRVRIAGIAAAALAASIALPASAQTFGVHDRRPFESPQNFAFELRFGPYVPAVDSEFTNVHPFQDIFGAPPTFNTQLPRVMASIEFEWQAVRVGPVGQLGIGASVGYTSVFEKAPFSDHMTGTPAMWSRGTEDTGLSIIPATLHLVARFDGLARRYRWFPIVPFVKAGLAYGFWWVSNGAGTVHVNNTQDAVGGSLGWHAALGAALMLDVFEPRLARGWDQSEGVNHSYVFFEYNFTDLAGFGGRPQLNVGNFSTAGGSSTPVGSWVIGLALEF